MKNSWYERNKNDPGVKAKNNQKAAEWYENNKHRSEVRVNRALRAKRWYKDNKERADHQEKARKKTNWSLYTVIRLKAKAKQKQLPFDLTEADIQQPQYCPVLGLELVYRPNGYLRCPEMATIDRMDPKLGYVKGNVHTISSKANRLKNNATLEEMEAIMDYMKRAQKKEEPR